MGEKAIGFRVWVPEELMGLHVMMGTYGKITQGDLRVVDQGLTYIVPTCPGRAQLGLWPVNPKAHMPKWAGEHVLFWFILQGCNPGAGKLYGRAGKY